MYQNAMTLFPVNDPKVSVDNGCVCIFITCRHDTQAYIKCCWFATELFYFNHVWANDVMIF